MEERVKELFARAAYHNIKQYQIAQEGRFRQAKICDWRLGRTVPSQRQRSTD
jgi:hypothetical protein